MKQNLQLQISSKHEIILQHKMKQNLQLKISSSRKKHETNSAALSALLSVVQTQSTHWQTGAQLKYGWKYFSMQTMQRFSAKDAMFPFL